MIVLKIGVTGGAGYVGSNLVKVLIADKHEVVSIDNLMNGDYSHLRNQGAGDAANLLEGDIRDLEFMVEAFEGCDAIAHLAALPGLIKCREHPDEATSINVFGTYNVLEASRRLDIGKVVFCSTAAVYGKPTEMPVTEGIPLRPLNLYGVTKLAGERLMDVFRDNHGIATTSLRFGNVFGVGLFTVPFARVGEKYPRNAECPRTLGRTFDRTLDLRLEGIELAAEIKRLCQPPIRIGVVRSKVHPALRGLERAVEQPRPRVIAHTVPVRID